MRFISEIRFDHLSRSNVYVANIRPFEGGVIAIWTRHTLVVLVMCIRACRTDCAHARFCLGNCSYTAEQALSPIRFGVLTSFAVLAR